MIIDSSAILAIFFREKDAEMLLSIILNADFAGIGSPTAAETGLVLTSRMNQNATGSLLPLLPPPASGVIRWAVRYTCCTSEPLPAHVTRGGRAQ